MFNKIKILIVGPKECGKTTLANFLAESTDLTATDYRPTQGVRILEFETEGSEDKSNLDVELWDCSGDTKYEVCWPALQKDVNGVVLVYNPGVAVHEKQLQNWHLHFCKEQGLKSHQCLLICHTKPGIANNNNEKLGGTFESMKTVMSNLEEDPHRLKKEFNQYLRG